MEYIKVLDSANVTLAILQNAYDTQVTEEINGQYTFNFSTPIDDKSADIYHGHKMEADGNYFNIMKTIKRRQMDGIYLSAACEHVSYDMLNVVFTAGYTYTGEASAAVSALLTEINTAITSNFTVGTIEITSAETISIDESVTGRGVLLNLVALYGGELEFNKYQVSLLTRRGADRGVQFRYRKNISDATVTVDYQTLKDDGSPTVTYQVNAAELEYESDYINSGYAAYEHYELGDTIKVIDDDLDIDTSARIVKQTFNPLQRMQGSVEIGDYVNDLTNTLTRIQTTTVTKDGVYNGCSIGPENGFVSERSDTISKTTMNATDGFIMQLKPTSTSSYTAVFYIQYDTATGTAKLYLSGDAEFAGTLSGADGTFTGTLSAGIVTGSTIQASNIYSSNIYTSVIDITSSATIGDYLYMQTNSTNEGIYFSTFVPTYIRVADPGGTLEIGPSLIVTNGASNTIYTSASQTITVAGGIITSIT